MDELTEEDLSGLLPPHRTFALEFLRVRAFVEQRIELGVPATAIHRELKQRGQISFSVRTLQRYLAQARERG